MNDIAVRELRIFEILIETFKLYKSGFRFLLPLCLMAFIPANIAELFYPQELFLSAFLNDPGGFLADRGSAGIIQVNLVVSLIRLMFTCIVTGGYTYIALSRFTGRPVLHGQVIDFTMSKWLAIATTGILFYAIIGLTAFMIFPLIYFPVIFIFHKNIAAISSERGFKALMASAAMVRGVFFKRLLYGFSFVLMQGVLVLLVRLMLSGILPSAEAELTAGLGITTVVLGVLIDTLSSVFILAQAVWFVNILLSRKVINIQGNS
jgi:hypothetical protein